jgi:translation initiation factor 1 (eIF-1/SUI1)
MNTKDKNKNENEVRKDKRVFIKINKKKRNEKQAIKNFKNLNDKEVIYNFNIKKKRCATSGNIQINKEYWSV